MQIGTEDIERIIQVVMQRLREDTSVPQSNRADSANATGSAESTCLVVDEPLITVATLKDRLSGIRHLTVPVRAVVTPAVIDLLRGLKIELSRRNSIVSPCKQDGTTSTTTARMMVCGSPEWLKNLARQFDASLIHIGIGCDQQCIEMLGDHFRTVGARAMWLADSPFAAALQTCRLGRAVAHLHGPEDLDAAIHQTAAELIVVDASRWPLPRLVNLLRAWLRRS